METGKYFLGFLLLIIITFSAIGQVIPVNRITDFTTAGYQGNIPVYPLVKNIIDFGGNGNGSSTNDLALQQAISSLNDQQGIVYFPAGTFFFNNPVLLSKGIVLKGEGAGNTTLLFNLAGSNDLIKIAGAATNIVTNIRLPYLKIQLRWR